MKIKEEKTYEGYMVGGEMFTEEVKRIVEERAMVLLCFKM